MINHIPPNKKKAFCGDHENVLLQEKKRNFK
jgi:hypothetical protein